MTRQDYMNRAGDKDSTQAHREYYGQFVDESVRTIVERRIGRERLLASTDPHFNDIPLEQVTA